VLVAALLITVVTGETLARPSTSGPFSRAMV
jgi:hypothetical protein